MDTEPDTAPNATPDPLVGTTLGGQFVIQRRLGEGGMGSVYLAHQTGMERLVVIKVMHAELGLNNSVSVERFKREARAVAALNHPHIIQAYSFGETENGRLYQAMEYVEGQDLCSAVAAGPFSELRALLVIDQAASALSEAHAQNIIHRDLKPENIMITNRHGQEWVKVLDFGIAKLHDDGVPSLTHTGAIFGTPRYMAPEQIRGEPVGPYTDLYALGLILYELVTGAHPFKAETAIDYLYQHINVPAPSSLELRPELRPELDTLIQRLLAKSPKNRMSSATELQQHIHTLIEQLNPNLPVSGVSLAQRQRLGSSVRMEQVAPPPADVPAAVATLQNAASTQQGLVTGPHSELHKSSKSRPWMWALGAVVLLGGGAAALVALGESSDSPSSLNLVTAQVGEVKTNTASPSTSQGSPHLVENPQLAAVLPAGEAPSNYEQLKQALTRLKELQRDAQTAKFVEEALKTLNDLESQKDKDAVANSGTPEGFAKLVSDTYGIPYTDELVEIMTFDLKVGPTPEQAEKFSAYIAQQLAAAQPDLAEAEADSDQENEDEEETVEADSAGAENTVEESDEDDNEEVVEIAESEDSSEDDNDHSNSITLQGFKVPADSLLLGSSNASLLQIRVPEHVSEVRAFFEENYPEAGSIKGTQFLLEETSYPWRHVSWRSEGADSTLVLVRTQVPYASVTRPTTPVVPVTHHDDTADDARDFGRRHRNRDQADTPRDTQGFEGRRSRRGERDSGRTRSHYDDYSNDTRSGRDSDDSEFGERRKRRNSDNDHADHPRQEDTPRNRRERPTPKPFEEMQRRSRDVMRKGYEVLDENVIHPANQTVRKLLESGQ